MSKNKIGGFVERHLTSTVVFCRLVVGIVFLFSGFTKAIDLYGFIYKIEQYFSVWGIDELRSLTLSIATFLSISEFLIGFCVLTGCYRRFSVYAAAIFMVVMTPFTLYIYISEPVDDCGCFGEALKISNFATFVKNIVLLIPVIALAKYNRRVKGFYNTYLNWIACAIVLAYVATIANIGFEVQPPIDFRDYKIGTNLFSTDDYNDEDIIGIFNRDGEQKTFSLSQIPDSTWSLVEIIDNHKERLTIFSGDEEGEDLTAEVATSGRPTLSVVIPHLDPKRYAYISKINRLRSIANLQNVDFISIVGSTYRGINEWSSVALPDYKIYSADDTSLKSVVRGDVAAVYTDADGHIIWKRNLETLNTDSDLTLSQIIPVEKDYFTTLSVFLGLFLLILKIIDFSGRSLKPIFFKPRKTSLTPIDNADNTEDENATKQT